jgi:hypothetical protein
MLSTVNSRREGDGVKTARKHRGVDAVATKRSRDDERKMYKLIDELCGCLTEGDALAELEREHRGEVLADERSRP